MFRMLSFRSVVRLRYSSASRMSILNYFSKTSGNDESESSQTPGGKKEKESPQMYHDKFLGMPLEEKRKLYRCKDSFVTLDDIPLWPCMYKVEARQIDKMIRLQKEKEKEKEKEKKRSSSFTFREEKDRKNIQFPCVDAYNQKVSLWQGDITALEIDAVVNAANETLLGGGGVDGCIHRAAGDSLRKECFFLDGACAGEAKLTCGHRLPAKYILHTVGPRGKQPDKLRSCYENCFEIVKQKGLRSVAFCCISTGIFGYPNRDAAHVALLAARKFLEENHENFDRVIFCTFMANDFNIYQELMADKYFPCTKTPTTVSSEKEIVGENVTEKEIVAKTANEDDRETDSAVTTTGAATGTSVAASALDHPLSDDNAIAVADTATTSTASPLERDLSEGDKSTVNSDAKNVGNIEDPDMTASANEDGDLEMNSQDQSQDLMDVGGNSQDVMAESESQGSMEFGSQPV